jgi:hypothetical protein
MIRKNFDATKKTLREILCNGTTYTVPSSRIRYHWIEEDWKSLWGNLAALLTGDGTFEHYMGAIVVIPSYTGQEIYSLMDGRQRLVTLSILVSTLIEHLLKLSDIGIDKDDNRRRAEHLKHSYIVNVNAVTLETQKKIVPDVEQAEDFKDLTISLDSLFADSKDKVTDSVENERAAFCWFQSTIQDCFGLSEKSGAAIADFAERLADRVCFTVIYVTDIGSAFSVQTTLK